MRARTVARLEVTMSKVKKSISVDAPVDVVYGAWRNFENFPRFMGNIEEVRVVDGGRSHWKAKGPLGAAAEWDAEITLDEPNNAIGWRSIGGDRSGVETAGRVNFRPREAASTEVDVTIEYAAPGGLVGEAVTKIFSNPERQIEEDLGRFKETIEKGVELSGFRYGVPPASGGGYGGSMGGATQSDLDRIANTNSGVTPDKVDDPATR
jgi:uncharacterized membrane protein